MLLSVDDDHGDLLIHEHQNGSQEGRDGGCQAGPPRIAGKGFDQPTPSMPGGVKSLGHVQFGSVYT